MKLKELYILYVPADLNGNSSWLKRICPFIFCPTELEWNPFKELCCFWYQWYILVRDYFHIRTFIVIWKLLKYTFRLFLYYATLLSKVMGWVYSEITWKWEISVSYKMSKAYYLHNMNINYRWFPVYVLPVFNGMVGLRLESFELELEVIEFSEFRVKLETYTSGRVK